MGKANKLLSLAVSAAMAASAFTGLTFTASAGDDTAYKYQETYETHDAGTIIQAGTEEVPSVVLDGETGSVTFSVGYREKGMNHYQYAAVVEDSSIGNKYIDITASNYSSSSRGIGMTFSDALSAEDGKVLVYEFDAKFDAAAVMTITGIGNITPDVASMTAGEWSHVKIILDAANDKYYVVNSTLDGTEQAGVAEGTTTADSLTSVTFYEGGSKSGVHSYFDNMTVYEADNTIGTLTVTVTDDNSAALEDATVKVAAAGTYTTDSNGQISVSLPAGSYSYTVSKDGYEATKDQKDSYEGTVDVTAGENAEESVTLLQQVYTPVPETVTMSGGQKVMTAPHNADTTSSAAYVLDIKDQNNIDITDADIQWTVTPTGSETANDYVAVADGVVTVAKGYTAGDTHVENYTVTAVVTKNDVTKTVSAAIDISDYLFYEPGIGGSSYGTTNTAMLNTDGTNSGTDSYIATPASKGTTETITLPDAITFTPGTAELLTFKTTVQNKVGYTFQRDVALVDSEGTEIVKFGYINLDIGDSSTATWSSTSSTFATTWGSISALNEWTDVSVLFKTNASGATKVTITVAGNTYELGETTAKDFSKINTYLGLNTVDRYALLKDIIVTSVDVTDIDIDGTDSFSTISGKTVSRDYSIDAMVLDDGETFTWSVTDADGAAVDGVKITPSDDTLTATLSAEGIVDKTLTVKAVSSTSTESAPKEASKTVTVAPAEIASAAINGVTTLENTTASTTYTVSDVMDQYGVDITSYITPVWSATGDAATIDSSTGVLTVKSEGSVTVTATLANGEITKDVSVVVTIAAYSKVVENPTAGDVDVSGIVSYGATTYTVTRADGTTFVKTASDNKITLTDDDLNGTTKIEIVPNYKFNLGDSAVDGYVTVNSVKANGYGFAVTPTITTSSYDGVKQDGAAVEYGTNSFQVDLPDGRYDMTFSKADTNRTHIKVNGLYTIPEADYTDGDGSDPITTPGTYTQKDVIVEGGVASVTADNWSKGTPYIAAVEITKKSDMETRKTHIWLAGDSTVTNYRPTPTSDDWANGKRRTGWGQLFEYYLDDSVIVDDYAHSGDYSVGWYNSTFPSVLQKAQAGDYLFIQFGINDRADKNNCPVATMVEYLGKMVDECRKKGVIPVLVTPEICISQYGTVGEHEQSTGSGNAAWFNANKTVAEDKDVLLIDLADLSGKLWATLGKTWVSQNYFLYNKDTSTQVDAQHMSYQGAKLVAQLVATEVYDQKEASTTANGGSESFSGIPVNGKSAANITYIDADDNTEKTLERTAVTFGEGDEPDPSETPSAAPSETPSAAPSETPSAAPSETPSAEPSTTPLPTPEVSETTNSDEGTTTYTVTVEDAPENSCVYVAEYDTNGLLIELHMAEPVDGVASVTHSKKDDAVLVKIFVWKDTKEPITSVWSKKL